MVTVLKVAVTVLPLSETLGAAPRGIESAAAIAGFPLSVDVQYAYAAPAPRTTPAVRTSATIGVRRIKARFTAAPSRSRAR